MRISSCPGCGGEMVPEKDEGVFRCTGCGCVVTVRPGQAADVPAAALDENVPEGASGKKAPDDAAQEAAPAKKQLNVFGPAAVALGAITIVFAFLAGIKALVLGIPALVVCGLGFLACALLKNVRKWMPAAGLAMAVIGIIAAVIMHEGLVF